VYTIEQFCALFGITPSKVHYYRAKGLLPPPHGQTRWATYGREHVRRMRLILEAKDGNVTLADLAERFAGSARP